MIFENSALTMQPQTQSKEGKANLAPQGESPEEPTFTVFPRLPIELRIKIWGDACSVTRNVDIWIKTIPTSGFCCPADNPYYWYSSGAAQAVLHVNQKSRIEGLKHYIADLGTNIKVQEEDPVPFTMSLSIPGRIYINWFNDRLCLLDPYSTDEYGGWVINSVRFQNFAERCTKNGLRYFAINTFRDPNIVTTNVVEAHKDSCFLEYIPRKMMLEEVLLFENQEWQYRRNNCTVIGPTFADVKEGVDRQLDFVKEKLTRYMPRLRDSALIRAMPLIRTCTATVQDSTNSN